ncbi:hypothetical protein LTR36_000557 [Oleoguttula mirabilis]|uniref:Uncharacterized protein n=1 Tax=Oleoguttula mirabilis TaxID=1507867 RepID=A0AAV9JQ31_9PEZI|nr:hypothetical protein LTR36_000557 [Oleoguttula mirabilis]
MDHLPISDVLSLRRSCKDLKPHCTKVMQKKCVRLYLHPTRLKDVLEVCESSDFAVSIEEIVLLGQSHPGINGDEFVEQQHLHYRTWPQFLACATDGYRPTYRELLLAEEKADPIPVLYEPLFSALARLTGVCRFSYACRPNGSGLCQVSERDIAAYSNAHAGRRHSLGGGHPVDILLTRKTYRWSDADMAICLLDSIPWPLTHIAFHQPLPLCDRINWDRREAVVGRTSDARLNINSTTSLTLTVPGNDKWSGVCLSLLNAVPSQRGFTIIFASSIDQWWEYEANVFRTRHDGDGDHEFSHHDIWREEGSSILATPPVFKAGQLSHFTIVGTSSIPDGLHAGRIIDFLRAHKDILRSIDFDHVFFSNYRGVTDIAGAMHTVLQCMLAMPKLESARFCVPRLGCDGGCSFGTDGKHIEMCGRYLTANPENFDWVRADVFDRLAEELGVKLKDGEWDFGEWVMRHRL